MTDQLDELGPIKFYILFNVTYSRIDDNDDNGKTEKQKKMSLIIQKR